MLRRPVRHEKLNGRGMRHFASSCTKKRDPEEDEESALKKRQLIKTRRRATAATRYTAGKETALKTGHWFATTCDSWLYAIIRLRVWEEARIAHDKG